MSEITTRQHLTYEEAKEFFGKVYYGKHHIPGKIKEYGFGFAVEDPYGMATFDSNGLTRFVLLCHEECVRGEIKASSPRSMKVCIWKRQGREGNMSERHPTIESAVEQFRGHKNGMFNPSWRPIEEWHDDISNAFWTRFPVVEPYYAGSPLDTDWIDGYYTHFIDMRVFDFLLNEEGNLK